MLHGVMLGPVMFSCFFGGARHGLYITLSKVSHKTENGTIHYPSCHLFYPVLNPFSFHMGTSQSCLDLGLKKKASQRSSCLYSGFWPLGGRGGGVNGLFTSRTVWGDLLRLLVWLSVICRYQPISCSGNLDLGESGPVMANLPFVPSKMLWSGLFICTLITPLKSGRVFPFY